MSANNSLWISILGTVVALLAWTHPSLSNDNNLMFEFDELQASSLSENDQAVVKLMGLGVVRLHTRLIPNYPYGRQVSNVAGCTAWRASVNLFATAWHCLPLRDQASCSAASITFDYDPPMEGPRIADSALWGLATEQCEEIVYSNSRLDFALFRVSMENFDTWKDMPILKVLPRNLSYPQTTTSRQRTGDRLVILHHPRLTQCVNIQSLETVSVLPPNPSHYVLRSYQSALMVSAFDRDNNPYCRIWVPQPGSQADRPIMSRPSGLSPEPTIRVPSRGHPNPGESFWTYNSRDLPQDLPPIGILHRCTTCVGSSGAPIGSLEPAPESGPARRGTVVGIHTGYYDKQDDGTRLFVGYGGTRMSVITQCVDMSAIASIDELGPQGEGASVIFAKGAEQYAVCDAIIPDNAPHLNCTEETLDVSDCRFYLQ